MKETLSLLLATVVILTLSLRSLKTVSAAVPTEEPVVAEETEKKEEKSESAPAEEIKAPEQETKEEEKAEETAPQTEEPEETTSQAEAVQEAPAPEPEPAPTPTPAPAPAPAPAPTPAPAVQSSSNNLSAEQRLNAAPLNPRYTGYKALDDEINRILNEVTNSNMSTYQKMKACYTYVATHTSYGRLSGKYYLPGANRESELAISLFYEGTGMCDCYSAAFSVLARAIGIDCYTHTGETKYASGEWDDHDWAQARINGVDYIFDANVEDNVNGGYGELYFCKTYAELSGSHR